MILLNGGHISIPYCDPDGNNALHYLSLAPAEESNSKEFHILSH
jgi:hypothetical protein